MENKKTNVGNNTTDQTDANTALADVLLEQLDKWINDCQLQADAFFKRRMPISETNSLAMKVAYMNVKMLIKNNR